MTPPQSREQRILRALERDGSACILCGYRLHPAHPDLSTDHLIPRLKGGPAWVENEVPACRPCNRTRGHSSPTDWIKQCEKRGWRPDRNHVLKLLVHLAETIRNRGGQRRARSYLDAQIRRLAPDHRPDT